MVNIPNFDKVYNSLVNDKMTNNEKELVGEIVEHYLDVFYDPDIEQFDENGFKEQINYIGLRIKQLDKIEEIHDNVFYG